MAIPTDKTDFSQKRLAFPPKDHWVRELFITFLQVYALGIAGVVVIVGVLALLSGVLWILGLWR